MFTRNLLALYGAIPWRGVPVMPVEIMLLPRWFPFHLDKVSYWARTVLVPLMVLNALKPRAVNAKGDAASTSCSSRRRKRSALAEGRASEIALVGDVRRHRPGAARDPTLFSASDPQAGDRACRQAFVTERLNGEDGLGAIFPAMVNALLMFDALGFRTPRMRVRTARPQSRNC